MGAGDEPKIKLKITLIRRSKLMIDLSLSIVVGIGVQLFKVKNSCPR